MPLEGRAGCTATRLCRAFSPPGYRHRPSGGRVFHVNTGLGGGSWGPNSGTRCFAFWAPFTWARTRVRAAAVTFDRAAWPESRADALQLLADLVGQADHRVIIRPGQGRPSSLRKAMISASCRSVPAYWASISSCSTWLQQAGRARYVPNYRICLGSSSRHCADPIQPDRQAMLGGLVGREGREALFP